MYGTPAGWTSRHKTLASFMRQRPGIFVAPGLTAQQIATALRADPEWAKVCHALGTPQAKLVREVAGQVLPPFMGLDLDVIAEGVRLACAGDLVAGLLLVGVGVVVLLFLIAAMNRSQATN